MILSLLLAPSVRAEDAASVLVKTALPTRGALPDTLTAYGTAEPAADGSVTLSVQSEGSVVRLWVTPGEAVHAGDRLIEFAPSSQAISVYQQAVSALDLARREQTHQSALLHQQLATRDQVAQADKAVADAEAALGALQRETGGRTTVQVSAPVDGIVTAIPVTPGDRTAPGAPLASLLRADGLVVTIGVEPADRARLHKGDPARLEALAGAGTAAGSVLRVDAMLNTKTRLVDADLSAPPGAIPGETFRAVVTVGTFEGWLVPRGAVLTDTAGAYLFQTAGGKAARVAVTALGSDAATTVVQGPVDPKRPVVVEGNYQLSDGMAVRQEGSPS